MLKNAIAALGNEDVVGARLEIIDHPRTPRALDTMRRPLPKLAVSAHVRPVTVGDEDDRSVCLPSCADYRPLRRDQPLIAGKNHGTPLLAEVIEHVDDKHRRAPCVELDRGFDLVG